MKVVWKFRLEIGGENHISVSRFSRVVLVALDPSTEYPAIWIEHDPIADKTTRTFVLFGTGDSIHGPAHAHVGSVIDGPLVWHVYERNG